MNDCTQTPASGESQSNKQSKAPPAAMSLSAMALLSAAPLPVPMDAQAWYIQHVALVHDLIYATVNATRVPADTGAQATLAQQALTKHAALITQSHPPVVVTRDGQHTIAYDELGEARAKVKVLKAELEQALKELVPARVDAAEWLEEHEWRLHDLLHKTARMAKNRGPVSGGAGISQGEDSRMTWKLRPVMKWASFMFHHAEKFNRQETFVAIHVGRQ